MKFENQYQKGKEHLTTSKKINSKNRKLFSTFFSEQEYKLKRINDMRELDQSSYKTLCKYVMYFKNLNTWFDDKPWEDLTREEIKDVYDRLEDGLIIGKRGKPISSTRDYINKVFKSRPFELAGKKDICKEIMRYPINRKIDVRFTREENILTILEMAKKPEQKLLLWLSWDIGENYTTFLQLKKKHFRRQIVNDKVEYIVQLPKEHLKRTRRARSEITFYETTVRLLDGILASLDDEDRIIPISQRSAQIMLDGIVKKAQIVCEPNKDKFVFKDMRSSAACHWLMNGFSTDWIRSRLGHAPSSNVLDKYVTYLALDKRSPKKHMETVMQNNNAADINMLKQQIRSMQQQMKEVELSKLTSIVK